MPRTYTSNHRSSASGLLSARPDATGLVDGSQYFATDTGMSYEAHVGVWREIGKEMNALHGERIPLQDQNGVTVGYVGASGGGLALWKGTDASVDDFTAPMVMFFPEDSLFLQNEDGSNSIFLDSSTSGGGIFIEGSKLTLGNSATAAGVDGTATPTTAAELADVLVSLGIIASHSIA